MLIFCRFFGEKIFDSFSEKCLSFSVISSSYPLGGWELLVLWSGKALLEVNVTSLSLFHWYYIGRCSFELAELVPLS